jgi:hypothetical protein
MEIVLPNEYVWSTIDRHLAEAVNVFHPVLARKISMKFKIL